MKKILLTALTAVTLTTQAQAFFGSDNKFIEAVEDKEFVAKVYGDKSYLLFENDEELYINGTKYDIKFDKNNHLTLNHEGEEVEKSYVSNYKDEVILFEIYSKGGQEHKQQVIYINKKQHLNPRICDNDVVTTQEAAKYLRAKNGRLYCNSLSRDTKYYYINKIKSQEMKKNLIGKFIDKNTKNTFEFFEDGTWSLNDKKQSLYSAYREDFIKLEYKDRLRYSIFGKPYFGTDFKKTNCFVMNAYKIRYSTETKNLNLCKQN